MVNEISSASFSNILLLVYWFLYVDFISYNFNKGFPMGSVVKNPPANTRNASSIPWSGRSPGEGNSSPFQYSCLENPMARGVCQRTVHGGHKSVGNDWATKQQLSWLLISLNIFLMESLRFSKYIRPYQTPLAFRVKFPGGSQSLCQKNLEICCGKSVVGPRRCAVNSVKTSLV